MGNIGLILSEEAYYGFMLSGLNHCFLAVDLASTRRAIASFKDDKNIALVIIEKRLKELLPPSEQAELEALEYPFFFEFDKGGAQTYNDEINAMIKRLGISVNGT